MRERSATVPKEHAHHLLPLVDELLEEGGLSLAQLDAVVCGAGPGFFSGLRVAVGMAQGLAFGADLPVLPVSTLAALAQAAIQKGLCPNAGLVLAALDARMGDMYLGLYRAEQGLAVPLEEDSLCPAGAPRLPAAYRGQPYAAVGEGWRAAAEQAREFPGCVALVADMYPEAKYLLPLAEAALERGEALQPTQVSPVYLRGAEAWKKYSRET